MTRLLADTSVWISRSRGGNEKLVSLLQRDAVACHPQLAGELACGNLKNRTRLISLLQALPMAIEADHTEVLGLIEKNSISGKGLSYIDVHLLSPALLSGVSLWTLDRRLAEAARRLNHAWPPRRNEEGE